MALANRKIPECAKIFHVWISLRAASCGKSLPNYGILRIAKVTFTIITFPRENIFRSNRFYFEAMIV